MKSSHFTTACQRLLLTGSAGFVILVLIDQLTKYLACAYLKSHHGLELIPGVFQLYYLENRGAAFGILHDRQLFFIVIALAMTFMIGWIYLKIPYRRRYMPLRCVAVLLSAGAVGNMLDRIFRGYVVDFLYFSLIDFPVFNIADCYVCIGIAVLILLMFTCYREESFDFLLPKH